MGNVVFRFKRGLSQKLTLQNPLEILVDEKDAIKVQPDTGFDTELKKGAHTLKFWMISQEKEIGVVESKIEVHTGSKYEITYEYSTIGGTGKVTITLKS